jgi:signal transduction histidine kinase
VRGLRLGIGAKLFLGFSGAARPVLVGAGLLLEGQARRALESELARRAEALATSISTSIPQEIWPLAFALGPGEEQSRTGRYVRARLEAVQHATGAEQVAVWTLDGRLIAESDLDLPIGSPAPRAALVRRELEVVARGGVASTPLFRTDAGRWVKIGMAPLPPSPMAGATEGDQAPRGVLLVGCPSQSLGVVAAMRGTLLLVGALGMGLVVLVALGISRALTRRIQELAGAARRMEQGDLESTVPVQGRDELRALGHALEAMRRAVRDRERELRAMVGSVAHEIRNPLGGLVLYAEMLARAEGLSAEQQGWARRILQEASQLERVVAEFLNYARPGAPAPEVVSARALLAECAESAAGSLGWGGSAELGAADVRVRCDPGHLRQVLVNLLRNAMQAAGETGRVRAQARDEAGDAEIRIEDSGPGIPDAERERVFEPFYTTRAEGAGLGLAIVRRLCDLNRVAIGIGESALGGACVWLRFPRPGKE